MPSDLAAELGALERGEGVLDLDPWRRVGVTGADAGRWLNDLITADLAGLVPGDTVRSLFLGPTGRIRADLLVHRNDEGFALLQGPDQPRPVDDLLSPYVLSAEVTLAPMREHLLLRPTPGSWPILKTAPQGSVQVGPEAFDAWRIRNAIASFPDDLDERSLPAEAGLDRSPVTDRTKGCFLGQEAVAKVRNLGHPNRLVVAVQASRPVPAGVPVFADGTEAGLVTSVDPTRDRPAALARIRWEARADELSTADGISLARG